MRGRGRPRKPPPKVHPLLTWMDEKGIESAQLAKMAEAFGQTMTPKYPRIIAKGKRRPSYEIAEALSKATGGAVTTEQIMSFRGPVTQEELKPKRPRTPRAQRAQAAS